MSETFNFFQQWYPILPIADLKPDRPLSPRILDTKLVIWKPRDSSHYSAFLDHCPHRLAPLSEGRIDEKTGHLECCYHGWQFNEQGTCTKIPQADRPDLLEQNPQQLRATALPTYKLP